MKEIALIFLSCVAVGLGAQSPRERRAALLAEPELPALLEGVADENAVVRHTAVRLLTERDDAAEHLEALLTSSDAQVRRLALQGLCLRNAASVEVLGRMAQDREVLVRQFAVAQLAAQKPAAGAVLELLSQIAAKEQDGAVRDLAAKAAWPFFRNTVLLRERPDWDHEVTVVQDFLLPQEKWLFALDPKSQGHRNGWFQEKLKTTGWQEVAIGATWESAGFDYDGVAWYRKAFPAPEKPTAYNAVELHFEAVDESAWVWLNGIYIGQHDLGPGGWLVPFSLDVTQEIRWGAQNTLVVRVLDTAGAGGIYRPVHLQVLE